MGLNNVNGPGQGLFRLGPQHLWTEPRLAKALREYYLCQARADPRAWREQKNNNNNFYAATERMQGPQQEKILQFFF